MVATHAGSVYTSRCGMPTGADASMNDTIQTANSDTTTEGVRVRAAGQYNVDESDPDRANYVYDYEIEISNESERTVQLRRRHWIIVDAHGNREDVRGPGVIGDYPRLAPGESYSYMSRCPLRSRWGTMQGSYTFVEDEGEEFEVSIGRFFLVPPAV